MAAGFEIPKPSRPYFGSGAQKHNDYLSAANTAANAIEEIYSFMMGTSKGRDGKPLLVRDVGDLQGLKDRIKEAEKTIQTVMKTWEKGQYLDADYLILYAKARLLSSVQNEYNKIKEKIQKGLEYEKQISEYTKEQAIKSAALKESSVQEDLQTLNDQEKHLFKF